MNVFLLVGFESKFLLFSLRLEIRGNVNIFIESMESSFEDLSLF